MTQFKHILQYGLMVGTLGVAGCIAHDAYREYRRQEIRQINQEARDLVGWQNRERTEISDLIERCQALPQITTLEKNQKIGCYSDAMEKEFVYNEVRQRKIIGFFEKRYHNDPALAQQLTKYIIASN